MSMSTKQLAMKMGVTTGTAIDAGRRLFWSCRPDPYSSGGFLWDVSDEQIAEYILLRERNAYLTIEQKRARVQKVFDLWDVAFSGKTFPGNILEIDLKKWKIAYKHTEIEETEPQRKTSKAHKYVEPPICPEAGCDSPRLRTSYGTFYKFCRAHHNERQRAAGTLYRARRKSLETQQDRKNLQRVVDNAGLRA